MKNLATFYDHILEIAKQERVSAGEALEEAARLGIAWVEVSYANAQADPRALAGELARRGLGVSAMPAFFDFGQNPDVEAQAAPVLEAAEVLGAKTLLVIPGFWAGDEAGRPAQTEAMLVGVERLGALADRRGIRLVMEEFDTAASPIATLEGLGRFLDRCPGLMACFDTGNFRFAAQDEREACRVLAARTGHVHLKDRRLTPEFGGDSLTALDGAVLYPSPVGGGVIRMEEILRRLKAAGYQGLYTIEHYGAAPMLDCLRRSAEWARGKIEPSTQPESGPK